jgi:hypothetical protein
MGATVMDAVVTVALSSFFLQLKRRHDLEQDQLYNSLISQKIEESAKNNDVPLIHFHDTSVILGKLCRLQFSVSAISINSLSDTNVQAILKEYEKK